VANEMLLPSGKKCGDCYAYSWCKKLFMCKETNVECDYYPVRFNQRATDTIEAANTAPNSTK